MSCRLGQYTENRSIMDNRHLKRKQNRYVKERARSSQDSQPLIRAKKLKRHQNHVFVDVYVNGSFTDDIAMW